MATSGGERGTLRVLALLAIVGVAVFLLLIAALHFLRPDVNPVVEPMSNYAVGPFGFLFTAAILIPRTSVNKPPLDAQDASRWHHAHRVDPA
jgi:hypothetical protein